MHPAMNRDVRSSVFERPVTLSPLTSDGRMIVTGSPRAPASNERLGHALALCIAEPHAGDRGERIGAFIHEARTGRRVTDARARQKMHRLRHAHAGKSQ